ncbi:MAG: pyridoxamine 5'-phosphate oxidase family protein [Acidimicrobiales bacterium]
MYAPTPETTPKRHPERARFDAETVHAVLDEALVGHLAFVADGAPQVLPLLFVRDGAAVYLHASTGTRPARILARHGALDVAFEVTLVDELVLARAAFSHSANYRCVVAHGSLRLIGDAARKAAVLDLLVDKIVPGRSADARRPDESELRQTAVMELALDAVSAKVRAGDPLDTERDLSSPVFAGRLPLLTRRGPPIPAADLDPAIPVPAYLDPPS